MDVIICGGGEVGLHSAEVLAKNGHNVTLIDNNAKILEKADQVLDIRLLEGSCVHGDVLVEAGARSADLLIAATEIDEVNMVACDISKELGTKWTVARVHHRAFFHSESVDYRDLFQIDHLVCPEHTTAQAIASAIRSPGAVAVENFARGAVSMQLITVTAGSRCVGRTLAEVTMPAKARIALLYREGKAFLPTSETVLEARDTVLAIGQADAFQKVREYFDTEARHRRRVIIMGGTSQAVWLCRELEKANTSVRLIVENEHRAIELAEKMPKVTVIHADAIRTDVLEEERVDQMDAFVACTEEEETNILAAARAKTMGVVKVCAVLQRATYQHLLSHIGIDLSFSPRSTAVSEILHAFMIEDMVRLHAVDDAPADVYQIRVEVKAQIIGKQLSEANFPPHTVLAALARGEEVFVPQADTELKLGDRVIAIVALKHEKTVAKLFGARHIHRVTNI